MFATPTSKWLRLMAAALLMAAAVSLAGCAPLVPGPNDGGPTAHSTTTVGPKPTGAARATVHRK